VGQDDGIETQRGGQLGNPKFVLRMEVRMYEGDDHDRHSIGHQLP